MRKLIPIVMLCAAFGFGCHRDSAKLQRTQEQYQVVQEGSAEGATATINGPQEVRPPVATDTGADTTTAFTLPGAQPAPAATNTTGSSVASTIPNTVSPPLPTPSHTTTQQPPMSSAAAPAPTPQPQPTQRTHEQHPARTDTTGSQPPAATTDTSSTTGTTATQPPANNDTASKTDTTKTDGSTKKNDNPPPSDTSTSQPPPPPPPMTDGVLPDIHAR